MAPAGLDSAQIFFFLGKTTTSQICTSHKFKVAKHMLLEKPKSIFNSLPFTLKHNN